MTSRRAIAAGVAAVALLDGLDAIVFYALRGVHPMRVFQGIAAGLLGRAAFGGGAATAVLGVCLHVVIASVVVLVYWRASRALPALARRPVLVGAAYGLVVYAVMTFLVVPLSAAGAGLRLPQAPVLMNGIFAHLVCVGIPTGLAARAASPSRGSGAATT